MAATKTACVEKNQVNIKYGLKKCLRPAKLNSPASVYINLTKLH